MDEAGITSTEVLQSVIEEIQAIRDDSDSSILSNSSENNISESSGNDSEAHDSEEDLEL